MLVRLPRTTAHALRQRILGVLEAGTLGVERASHSFRGLAAERAKTGGPSGNGGCPIAQLAADRHDRVRLRTPTPLPTIGARRYVNEESHVDKPVIMAAGAIGVAHIGAAWPTRKRASKWRIAAGEAY